MLFGVGMIIMILLMFVMCVGIVFISIDDGYVVLLFGMYRLMWLSGVIFWLSIVLLFFVYC